MVRYFSRCLLIGMIVVSALVGSVGQLGSTAAAQEPQFTAAVATPIEQNGQIGKIYLSTVPLPCAHRSTPSKSVNIGQDVHPSIGVTKPPDNSSQKIGVVTQLRQVDPYGKHELLASGAEYFSSVTSAVYPTPFTPLQLFPSWPAGPDYYISYLIKWYPGNGGAATGVARVNQSTYLVTVDGGFVRDDAPICSSYWKPIAEISAITGTVNSTINYGIGLFPLSTPVAVKWDGTTIASVSTTDQGTAYGSLRIPAAPMGTHKLTFSTGHWIASANYTVKPRIKLTPTTDLKRGQTVNVSLRGYAKYETVNIRWKKGTSWVQVGQVKTSGTGSANIYIKVPTWAPAGTNSVRGDGTYGHAQTNAVTVVVSASTASSANASPTPTKTATPTPTKTPTPAPTAISATATPIPSPTASPTAEVSTPEPTETPAATASPEATETATPVPVTETPVPEPTAEPSAETSPGAAAPGEGTD